MFHRPFSVGAPRSVSPTLPSPDRVNQRSINTAQSNGVCERHVLLLSAPDPRLNLHCLRYLPFLAQRVGRVTLIAPDWLADLARWTERRIEVSAAAHGVHFDVQLRLSHLHESCRLRGIVPLGIPYINVPHNAIRCSERRLANMAQGRPRAAWIGTPGAKPVEGDLCLQLLHMRGVAWYNELPSPIDRNILRDDSAHRFARLAPVFECLDLVVTDDPSIACLGGALGRETWLLVPGHRIEPARTEMQECFLSVTVLGYGSPKLDAAVIARFLHWYNEYIDGLVRLSA